MNSQRKVMTHAGLVFILQRVPGVLDSRRGACVTRRKLNNNCRLYVTLFICAFLGFPPVSFLIFLEYIYHVTLGNFRNSDLMKPLFTFSLNVLKRSYDFRQLPLFFPARHVV